MNFEDKIQKKNYAVVCYLLVLLWFVGLFMADLLFVNFQMGKLYTAAALALFAIEIYFIMLISRDVINAIILFEASFYVFQNGQLMLRAFDIKFNSFYIDTLPYLYEDVALYSAVTTILAGAVGVCVAYKAQNQKKKPSRMARLDRRSVEVAAIVAVIACAAVVIPLTCTKFFGYALEGGYHAVREFEEGVPRLVGFIEYLFYPFCMLLMAYTKKKWIKIPLSVILLLWSVITALCGDRTTGIAGIMVLVLFFYMSASEKNKKRSLIFLLVIGIVCIALVGVARSFRSTGSLFSNDGEESFIVGFISELGFSAFPLFMMMDIVPGIHPFQSGLQYISSAITGFIPSILDVTGFIERLTDNADIYNDWYAMYFDHYKFGLGFSLNAESYINFGFGGPLALSLILYVVLSYLAVGKINKGEPDRFKIYCSLALLFAWFTLPRRSSYYVWNALFWCVLTVSIYIVVMCFILNKTVFRKKGKSQK